MESVEPDFPGETAAEELGETADEELELEAVAEGNCFGALFVHATSIPANKRRRRRGKISLFIFSHLLRLYLSFLPVAKQRRNCGKIVALLFTQVKMGYNNIG